MQKWSPCELISLLISLWCPWHFHAIRVHLMSSTKCLFCLFWLAPHSKIDSTRADLCSWQVFNASCKPLSSAPDWLPHCLVWLRLTGAWSPCGASTRKAIVPEFLLLLRHVHQDTQFFPLFKKIKKIVQLPHSFRSTSLRSTALLFSTFLLWRLLISLLLTRF